MRDDEPQPPRQLVRDIPPELERACLKALAKRLQDRYTTAADFAEDLRRVCQSPPDRPRRRHPGDLRSRHRRASRIAARPLSSQQSVLTSSSSRRRAREAERRQVTVLVCGCDLFESEAYLEASTRRTRPRCCGPSSRPASRPCAAFDGTVVQCNEQGLLVCFGYPVAYEDAARRAAQAGLGILEDMKALGEQLRREHEAGAESVGRHPHRAGRRGGEGGRGLAGGGGAERGRPAGGRRRARPGRHQRRPPTG